MKTFITEFKKLEKTQKGLETQLEILSNMFQLACDFNCYVVWVSGDGFCLLNEETNGDIAPLRACIEELMGSGKLTTKSHKKLCI